MILTKKWKIKEKNKVLSKYKQDIITIIGADSTQEQAHGVL